MTINDRIQQLADVLFSGNVSAFGRAINVKQATLNTILGGRKSKPSFEVLASIVNAKALNVSAAWLLTGEGNMLAESAESLADKDELTKFILSDNRSLRARVEELIIENTRLEEQIKEIKKETARQGFGAECADAKESPLAG